jgi:hypothetical protein
MPKLYELTDNYNQVWDMLNSDDTNLQMVEDTLQSIEANIELKAENSVYLVKNLEAYSDGIENEIIRLKGKLEAVDKKIDSIKNYMFGQLEIAGLSEVKTSIATIKQQINPPAVCVENEKLVPIKYLTMVPASFIVRKSDIARDLKAGVEVAGCKLTQTQRWKIS